MRFGPALRTLGLVALSLASHAGAQQPDTAFRIRWTVAPDPPRTGPFLVNKQQEVHGGALYPSGLVTLSEPIVNADNSLSFPAGTQLVVAEARAGVACTLSPRARFLVRIMSNAAYGYHSCFVDRDGDSRFDGGFYVTGNSKYSIIQGGRVPAELLPIEGGAFVRAEPRTLRDAPRASVNFYQRNWGGGYEFTARAGDSGPPARSVRASEFGTDISYGGIVFRVLRKAEHGALEVELVQGFEPRGIQFGYR